MFDSIIFIILMAIVIIVLFKIIKSIVKVIMIGMLILLFLGGTLGFIIYKDIGSLKDNIGEEPRLYLILEDDEFTSGYIENETINASEIERYNGLYSDKKYKEIKGEYYKVVIIKGDLDNNPEKFISEMSIASLFSEYKNGNIDVYPKTILFAIAQKAPIWLVKPVLWLL